MTAPAAHRVAIEKWPDRITAMCGCGWYAESMGRDESSRGEIRARCAEHVRGRDDGPKEKKK